MIFISSIITIVVLTLINLVQDVLQKPCTCVTWALGYASQTFMNEPSQHPSQGPNMHSQIVKYSELLLLFLEFRQFDHVYYTGQGCLEYCGKYHGIPRLWQELGHAKQTL